MIKSAYLVPPHSKVRLDRFSTDSTGPYKHKDDALKDLDEHRKALHHLQERMTAEGRHALLVILQAMDTGGKDGTIEHIFTGVNPQACDVTSFKVPSPLELAHDYLWRAHNAVPRKGVIGIFNRSHYEDVLVVRVHGQITGRVARSRIEEIADFERMLAANGVTILKFFLHISYQEQGRRLQERLDDRSKYWKVNPLDYRERELWPDYQRAYEEAIAGTSRRHAPWYIIPSDHKWYRNAAISRILVETLRGLRMHYPPLAFNPRKLKVKP